MTENPSRLSAALVDRYKILSRLGEGGMATVYLAEDLKHHRKVAVKVLRPELAAVLGAERFVQEITTTANLQHPHILPLFDSGSAGGGDEGTAEGRGMPRPYLYYVMPFIDGETLRDKLDRETQLGIDEAIKITTDVADALDYAHRQGVIHRDIKPENILLHDGRPMVADFGIALAVSAAAGGRMTETGLSLGTPHYMSPEQATAEKEITNRSDIYSLGSMLYEMLTGNPPHVGSTAQQIIMKIVTEEAQPVTNDRKSVPANVAAAVAQSLEKLAADRFPSANKFAAALSDVTFTTTTLAAAPSPSGAGVPAPALYAMLLGAILIAVWGWFRPASVVESRAMSVQIGLPEGYEFEGAPGANMALSPDGTKLAVLGLTPNSEVSQLLVRPLDATAVVPVHGSEGAIDPAWSPSGDSLAFVVGNQLKVASLLPGGGISTLSASVADYGYGVSWSEGGEIAYIGEDSIGENSIKVLRVADRDEEEFSFGTERVRWPHWVPGERRLTFTDLTDLESGSGKIGLLDVGTGDRVDSLTVGFNGRITPPGHLVWADRESRLWAATVDTDAGRLDGAPSEMLSGVFVAPGREARFTLSRSGDLAYVRAADRRNAQLVVVEVGGGGRRPIPIPSGVHLHGDLDLSPDGSKVAFSAIQFTSHDVWLADIAIGARPERFSSRWGISHHPVWTPNGDRLLFRTIAGLAWRPYDRRSALSVLLPQGGVEPNSWSADGTRLFGGNGDIWMFNLPDSTLSVLVETEARERTPALSPDGRWLAYASDFSGSNEIWVRAFEGGGGPWRVSEGGGITPIWNASGDRLYFRSSTAIMSADIHSGSVFGSSTPTVVIASSFPSVGNSSWEKSFDVFPDGERVILYEVVGTVRQKVIYETRWVQRVLEAGSR